MMVGGVSIAKIRDPVYPLFQSNLIILRSDSNPLGGMGGIGLLSSREEKISHMCKGQINTPDTPKPFQIGPRCSRHRPIGIKDGPGIFQIDTPSNIARPSNSIKKLVTP